MNYIILDVRGVKVIFMIVITLCKELIKSKKIAFNGSASLTTDVLILKGLKICN